MKSGDILKVIWKDARSIYELEDGKETAEYLKKGLAVCISVGWLIGETDEAIMLAMSIFTKTPVLHRSIIMIPKVNIVEQKELKHLE